MELDLKLFLTLAFYAILCIASKSGVNNDVTLLTSERIFLTGQGCHSSNSDSRPFPWISKSGQTGGGTDADEILG
jgi:hypothetical protein